MLGYVEYYVPGSTGPAESIAEAALRDGRIVFMALDKNRDGKITLDESPSPKNFKEADANADGIVTLEEFGEYWKRQAARLRAR
jgi:Ca2+-binding EF-hand superfamily protein